MDGERNYGHGLEKMKGVRLVERDVEIMAALERWGQLSVKQLDALCFRKGLPPEEKVRLFFGDSERADYGISAYMRLRTLEKSGFIRRGPFPWVHRYYMLTGQGHMALRYAGRAKFRYYRKGFPDRFFNHELNLIATGLVLEELLGLKVMNPREWHSKHKFSFKDLGSKDRMILPDLQVMASSVPVAIELELTQKASQRYQETWDTYRHKWPKDGLVLYLTNWPNGPECLLNMAQRWGHEFIHAARLSDFKNQLGCCAFAGRRPDGSWSEFFLGVSTVVTA